MHFVGLSTGINNVSLQEGGVLVVVITKLYVSVIARIKTSENVLKNFTGKPSGPESWLFFICLIDMETFPSEIGSSSIFLWCSVRRFNKASCFKKDSIVRVYVVYLNCIVFLKSSQSW